MDDAVARAMAHRGSPAVVEIRVCPDVDVLPMVPAGGTLSEMLGAGSPEALAARAG